MQYLWKWVDDLVGKGLEVSIVLELLFYASATFVSLAAPLAVLLSSLMTFGTLGERYEIIAMKAAGISTKKLISSLALFVVLIAVATFWFSDNVAPKAYYKTRSLLRNIMDQKPTLSIQEGVFYDGFDKFVIRVGKKGRNNSDIYDVLIFDHTKYKGNTTFVYAKKGKMETTEDQMYMLFHLFDGFAWDEDANATTGKNQLVRSVFAERYQMFDISSFKFEKTEEDFYSTVSQALSNVELSEKIDSIKNSIDRNNEDIMNAFFYSVYSFKNYVYHNDNQRKKDDSLWFAYQDLAIQEKENVLDKVLAQKNDFSSSISVNNEYQKYLYLNIAGYKVEWFKKYILALACILFFFIGAPLGSIIRKGGIGLPLVITVVFFSTYFMFSVFGERIAKGGAVPVWFGSWLSTFVLLPIGVFLTYQASVDAALFSTEELSKKIQQINLKKIFFKKKNENTATH
jgi:lipopolysaccharide export system permease protein